MKKAATSALIGAASITLTVGLALSVRGHQADDEKKSESSKTSEKKSAAGVKMDRETQERIGIALQPLKPASGQPEVTLYGTLEADPSEEFALRSPLAGVLTSDGHWPVLGADIAAGRRVGMIRPRLMPLDQLTLTERLASTDADIGAAKAAARAADEELNRMRQLNADNKNASDKALGEAEANAAAAEARVRSSEASQRLIAAALQPESNVGAAPLEMRKGGQVIEVAAQPGESVEPGQLLLRVSRFDRLLARLYAPPGQEVDLTIPHAMIAPTGRDEEAVPAQRVALAGSVDPKFQGQTLLFRLSPSKMALRPGQAVTARVQVPGRSEAGVLIPSGAILRFQRQVWIYVQSEPAVFVRHMVTLDRPAAGGWIVTSGFQPGQQVVVSGAQLLLSEEMKSKLESDEE